MNHTQIYGEYLGAVTDFAQKLMDIDKKHGTYLKCSIVDERVSVSRVGRDDDMVCIKRIIELHDIVLAVRG